MVTVTEKIVFRAIVEVLGKPKEHVDKSLKQYIAALRQDPHFKLLREEYADLKKHDDSDLWAAFAELEVETPALKHVIVFCFEYMPSMIEIIEPVALTVKDVDLSQFFNDLQARLHNVDMVAKELKAENDLIKQNTGALLQNYVLVVLGDQKLTSAQLSKLTGVEIDRLEDFLDKIIDAGKIDLEKGKYFRVKKGE
ncbi:TPA: hypothetical protein HA241_06345 [Candidatus Woesearchaeota archaeon]|nr:hypothetical protein [Candidatus Woesearchaeota archaeon]